MCIISSYVNSNWSYSPETVKLGLDLCDLDLWPWLFAWTLLLSLVITPENFVMIRGWKHSEKGVREGQTDRGTDGQTENTICRAAWSQLKSVTDRRTDGRTEPFMELLGRSYKCLQMTIVRVTAILVLGEMSSLETTWLYNQHHSCWWPGAKPQGNK